MALTQEELNIAKELKGKGISSRDIANHLGALRTNRPSTIGSETTDTGGGGYSFAEAGGDIAETFKGFGKQTYEAGSNIADRIADPKQTVVEKVVGSGSDLFRGVGRSIGEVVIGAGKVALPQEGEDAVKTKVGEVAQDISETETVHNLVAEYESLSPEMKTQVDNIMGYVEGVTEIATGGQMSKIATQVIRGVKAGTRGATEVVGDIASATGKTLSKIETPTINLPDNKVVTGAIDKGKEFAERVPRAVERGKEAVVEATERAEVIRKSTPAVGEAIKVNVPETTIDITTKASPATRADMLKQLDIADAGKKSDVRVTSVAGDSSAKQYTLIDDQRKVVGKQIEEAIDALPDKSVNMTPGLEKLAGNLAENGLEIVDGKVTRTSRSAHSTAELKAIQQLYDEAIRGIDELGTLDALSIHSRDRLFSKLKRESRSIEGLDDILVKVTKEDGTVGTDSIYNLFRDVYRTQLDELSPEMRAINTEYAKYRQFVDEMDNTIFKSSKTNQNIDPSLSAAINLRRIESNALSQPLFKQTADEMDRLARELGYEGSTPSELLQFALELETIYPNTVPKAGFSGGIRTGIMGALEKVVDVGAPNLKDQQRALRGLLDEGQVPTAPVGAIDESVSSVKSTTPNPESGIINFGAILSAMFGKKKPKLVKKKGGGGRSITFKDSKTGKTVKLKNMTNANFSDWQAFLDSKKVKYKTGF